MYAGKVIVSEKFKNLTNSSDKSEHEQYELKIRKLNDKLADLSSFEFHDSKN